MIKDVRLRKRGRNIASNLVLLAGLIIWGHAVVPHHHHFDELCSSFDNTACTNELSESQDETMQFHCHAFNLLVNQKADSSLLQTPAHSELHLYTGGQPVEHNALIGVSQRYKYPTFITLQAQPFSSAGYGLRAPPLFNSL